MIAGMTLKLFPGFSVRILTRSDSSLDLCQPGAVQIGGDSHF